MLVCLYVVDCVFVVYGGVCDVWMGVYIGGVCVDVVFVMYVCDDMCDVCVMKCVMNGLVFVWLVDVMVCDFVGFGVRNVVVVFGIECLEMFLRYWLVCV